MEFVEELNSYNSAKSLRENSTKNIKESIISPTGKSECAFVPNPLYLTPSASVDLGNTLKGQLKFSLRSADKGRGERGKESGGWGGKRTLYFETSFIVCPLPKRG